MDKFELPKDPKDLKNYNPVAILDEMVQFPKETAKDKILKIFKKALSFICTSIKGIYKYFPVIFIVLLSLYIIFQTILFIGNTNFAFTHWKWAIEFTKNTDLLCFKHSTWFLEYWIKIITYIYICKFIRFSSKIIKKQIDDDSYPSLKQYTISLGIVGVLYCIFNNTFYEYFTLGLVVFGILDCLLGGFKKIPILSYSEPTSNSYSSCSSCSSSGSNWENVKAERDESERRRKLEEQQRQREQDERIAEEKRKANTIEYALQRNDKLVEIRLANGHTFSVWGTLISSTSSTVSVNFEGWINVYNAQGSKVRSYKS